MPATAAVDHASEARRHLRLAVDTLAHTDPLASEDCQCAAADALVAIAHALLALAGRLPAPAAEKPGGFVRCPCGRACTAAELFDGAGLCPHCGEKLVPF